MIDLDTPRKAWALLDARERRNAGIVLAVIIVAALGSAGMVGSVMPFLSVLAQPSRIESVPALAWAYNSFGFTSDYAFLIALGLASLAVILIANGLQMLRTYAMTRFTQMRVHSLSSKLLAAYLRQPYAFFLDRHSGTMSTQILAESAAVVQRFIAPAAQIVASFFTVTAILALLIWVEPIVAVAAFAVLGGSYGLVFVVVRPRLGHLGKIRVESNKARYRIAGEALSGIKDVKLSGQEATYLDRYGGPSRRMAGAQIAAGLIGAIPSYALQVIAFGGVILLCLILVTPEGLSSGEALGTLLPVIGVFAFAGQRLMPELGNIYRGLTQLRTAAAAVDAVHADIIDSADIAVPSRRHPDPLGLHDRLELDAITYRYPRDSRAGLTDVSLALRAGERVGIVGSTGAGKTTLVDVVLGLLRPAVGTIRIDGVPLTEANLRAWQQGLAYVPQEIFLLDTSVAENIAFGVPPEKIDRARVVEAARIAQLDHFIEEELPEGYDTAVGERGVRLSGGQRQRIGIARALYRNADVIVFDEATSALDNLTEREVMSAIDGLPGDKTVLMIAHRLSTVKRCDRIVVLEQGRVAGVGTWDALMAENGAFRAMAKVA